MKNTLQLPKTDFSMSLDKSKEQAQYQRWAETAFSRMVHLSKGRPKFVLHDGPPYANGHIHLGHALNKIVKDAIVKTEYFFNGKQPVFRPGWDCHGLPLEMKAKQMVPAVEHTKDYRVLRDVCRFIAADQVEKQQVDFQALGVFADWKNRYVTMDYEYEGSVYEAFMQLYQMGYVDSKNKPVKWSWAAQTALAEAEVEYKDHESPSALVAFPVSQQRAKNLYILIWTTTPWTLYGNVAVALHPDENYVAVSSSKDSKILLVGEKRLDWLRDIGVVEGKIRAQWTGKDWENCLVRCPLHEKEMSRIIMNKNADPNKGTGCTHIAPSYGEEDFYLCENLYHPPLYVEPDGTTNIKIADCEPGIHVFDLDAKVLDWLQNNGFLFGKKDAKIKHSYPFCWRTKTPLIYRSCLQRFINLEHNNLIGSALKAVDQMEFVPERQKDRLKVMIQGRKEWCISRQRAWGVPASIFPLSYAENIKKEGCNSFFDNKEDTLDVWFDSGMSWKTLNEDIDLYVEGNDQHRGWFNSSTLLSVALRGLPPCKKIITHGFVVDDSGYKMSKSGKSTSPNDLVKKYGAEVVRTWILSSDYQRDIKFSHDSIARAAEDYRKIRNTFRFLLANLDEVGDELFKAGDPIAMRNTFFNSEQWIVTWILDKTAVCYEKFVSHCKDYDFYKAFTCLNEFVRGDLNSIYFNAAKDSLYCDRKNCGDRVAHQFALGQILHAMVSMCRPFWTFSCQEILDNSSKWFRNENDVFSFPNSEISGTLLDEEWDDYWKRARNAFHEKFDELKSKKLVKDLLEVNISMTNTKKEYWHGIDDWFGVSDVWHYNLNALATFEVDGDVYGIIRSPMKKCPRCWKHAVPVAANTCSRCKCVVIE